MQISPRHLIVAGGGGAANTGVKNGLEVFQVHFFWSFLLILVVVAFTLGFVLCIPHMILKHQIISRFLQTERMLLEKVSPDTSLGSSQFTAWQSGLQVEAQKILACSIMLSRRRQQQRAVEGSSGCRTWRILSSVSTVFAKVLFSMINWFSLSRSQGLMRCLGNGGRVPKRPGRAWDTVEMAGQVELGSRNRAGGRLWWTMDMKGWILNFWSICALDLVAWPPLYFHVTGWCSKQNL